MRPYGLNSFTVRHSNVLHIGKVVSGLATLAVSNEVKFWDRDMPGSDGFEAGALHGRVSLKSRCHS